MALSGTRFGELLEHAVEGQDDVRAVADEQPAPDVDAAGLQAVDLAQQRLRIHHHAVADDGLLAFAQDARGDRASGSILRSPMRTVWPALWPP